MNTKEYYKWSSKMNDDIREIEYIESEVDDPWKSKKTIYYENSATSKNLDFVLQNSEYEALKKL